MTAQSTQWHSVGGHDGAVHAVAFSPDGTLLASGGADAQVKLWNVATGQKRQILVGHTDEVRMVQINPHQQCIASASFDGSIRLWNLTTFQEQSVFLGNDSLFTSLAFVQKGRILVGGSLQDECPIRLWDVQTSQLIASIDSGVGVIASVATDKEGVLLACAGGDKSATIQILTVSS